MNPDGILSNRALICGIVAWALAQLIKPLIEYPQSRQWNWGLCFSSGGMPSSHSSLAVGTMAGIGLYAGFDHPAFAIAVAVAMIVVYDAAGVRRQAGIQAQKINLMINEFFSGHPISEEQLKEVIGHTPFEVIVGILLGIGVAVSIWVFWH